MSIGNLPQAQTPQPPQQSQTNQQNFPLANPASDETAVLSAETRMPVVGRKGQTEKSQNGPTKEQMSSQEAEKLAQRMNQMMGLIEKRLKFKVTESKDSSIPNVQVQVIDEKTGKVLAIIPPKKLEDLFSNVRDAVGFLYDEPA